MNWIEYFGYAASALIALSLMMNNIWRLRWINLIGASSFAIYGLVLGIYPVFFLNAFISLTDIYYIVQMSRKRDYFSILEVRPESNFLDKFLYFYRDDIRTFFPDFQPDQRADKQWILILRNLVPVGVFAFTPQGDGSAYVHLDYVRPEYRDLKNARFLFREHQETLLEKGISKLITHSDAPAHRNYLKKIGFTREPGKDNFSFLITRE